MSEEVRGELRENFQEIEADVFRADGGSNYVKDENGGACLEDAISNLEGAGVLHAAALLPPLKSLCWYTEIDPEKVRRLQALLNQMELGDQLLEDGVYGKETLATWLHFLNVLEHGAVPMLAWIDPSENNSIEINLGYIKTGGQAGLKNASLYGKHPYIWIDPPHPGTTSEFRGKRISNPHINMDALSHPFWFCDKIRAQGKQGTGSVRSLWLPQGIFF